MCACEVFCLSSDDAYFLLDSVITDVKLSPDASVLFSTSTGRYLCSKGSLTQALYAYTVLHVLLCITFTFLVLAIHSLCDTT